ncbi:hypothetical protein NPIL_345381, partial [Nephila pilipes]
MARVSSQRNGFVTKATSEAKAEGETAKMALRGSKGGKRECSVEQPAYLGDDFSTCDPK